MMWGLLGQSAAVENLRNKPDKIMFAPEFDTNGS